MSDRSRKISVAAVLVLGVVCVALSVNVALKVVFSWGPVYLGSPLALLFPVGMGLIAIGGILWVQVWRKTMANKKLLILISLVILNATLLSVVFVFIGSIDNPFLSYTFVELCWYLMLYFALPLLAIFLVIYVIIWQVRLGPIK